MCKYQHAQLWKTNNKFGNKTKHWNILLNTYVRMRICMCVRIPKHIFIQIHTYINSYLYIYIESATEHLYCNSWSIYKERIYIYIYDINWYILTEAPNKVFYAILGIYCSKKTFCKPFKIRLVQCKWNAKKL